MKEKGMPGPIPAEKNARRILRFLASRKEKISPLLILTHDYPDPDSLASAFALYHVAQKRFGITARIAYGGIIGRMENRAMAQILKIPAHRMKPAEFKKYEHVALMDTQPLFENNSFPKTRRAVLVIDQHPFVQKPDADLVIVDPECGATSVILAQALLLSKIKIPDNVATALAYGIMSDTLNLFRAARPRVISTYFQILSRCDLLALAQIQNPTHSRKFFTTLGKALARATLKRGLLTSHLGEVENPDLVSQIADFLLTYKGIRWSVCPGRFKGKLHVSFRTVNPNAEAGEILRDVFPEREQAGGHNGIGGGSFRVGMGASEKKWHAAEGELTQRLFKRLRIPIKGEPYLPFRK